MNTIIKIRRIYFDDADIAWAYIKATIKYDDCRVSNYGFDGDRAKPYWVETQHLIQHDNCTQIQLELWKAGGKFEHDN